MTDSLKSLLLIAPEGHIDPSVMDLIRMWDEPLPTAANVLETLDAAVYCGGASKFVMGVLNGCFESRIAAENTSYAAVVDGATWRKERADFENAAFADPTSNTEHD